VKYRRLPLPIRRLFGDERGATAIEYGLVVALIAIGAMAALMNLADDVVGTWTRIAAKVTGI
jgi:pilus assembly protein Flp/PilA